MQKCETLGTFITNLFSTIYNRGIFFLNLVEILREKYFLFSTEVDTLFEVSHKNLNDFIQL